MKHYPEPWSVFESDYGDQCGIDADGPSVVIFGDTKSGGGVCGITKERSRANAARIVACVNACAGIEDPASAISDAREALELALEVIEATGPGSYPEAENAIAGALAKLKGGAE